MSEDMWFLIGMTCGVGVTVWLTRKKPTGGEGKAVDTSVSHRSKEWVQTRNFLYYDGTMMPEIKEDLNEQ